MWNALGKQKLVIYTFKINKHFEYRTIKKILKTNRIRRESIYYRDDNERVVRVA